MDKQQQDDYDLTMDYLRDCRNDSIMPEVTEAVDNTLPLLNTLPALVEALENTLQLIEEFCEFDEEYSDQEYMEMLDQAKQALKKATGD